MSENKHKIICADVCVSLCLLCVWVGFGLWSHNDSRGRFSFEAVWLQACCRLNCHYCRHISIQDQAPVCFGPVLHWHSSRAELAGNCQSGWICSHQSPFKNLCLKQSWQYFHINTITVPLTHHRVQKELHHLIHPHLSRKRFHSWPQNSSTWVFRQLNIHEPIIMTPCLVYRDNVDYYEAVVLGIWK